MSLRSVRTATLILVLTGLSVQPAWALIMGDVGNSPVHDPGWQAGAEAVFNVSARIAWWEGPPFGGGQWHAECRGDAEAFNKVLADFALIEAQTKRLVVHDGEGRSFWINPNREVDKQLDAQMDWMFMVWIPENWRRFGGATGRMRPRVELDAGAEPVPQIDVYAGGNINWADVVIPDGIEVADHRLEAHGFSLSDGTVIEGTVHDLVTGDPISATMQLQFVEALAEGGYNHTIVETVECDADGHWALKSAPEGWHRITLSADGFVSRVVDYAIFDEQPKWSSHNAGLSPAAMVSGIVTDDAGTPLEGVTVRLSDIVTEGGGLYRLLADNELLTDDNGRFESDEMPQASMSVWTYKEGFCHIGLGEEINTPVEGIELTMVRSSRVEVVVDFGDTAKPESYIVHMEPEGGSMVGKWSGSGNVDASGFISYENVPPGTYVLWGRPNPGSADEQTESVTVELLGGETTEVALQAR